MRTKHGYERKELLVHQAYQLRFVRRILMAVFLLAALSAFAAGAIIWTHLRYDQNYLDHTTAVALLAVGTTLAVELILAVPIVIILGIQQSHRIVGPLNRIKKTLEAIGRGDFSQRIHLRKGDALTDLADDINRMAASLEKRSPPS